jgi:hypothetical protein
MRRGLFIMKDYTPDLINTYYCVACKKAGREHEVIEVSGPQTDLSSQWGSGVPTTMRRCSGCGAEDGPWVSSKIVGGGW